MQEPWLKQYAPVPVPLREISRPQVVPDEMEELKADKSFGLLAGKDEKSPSWIHWPLIAQAFPTLLLSTAGFIMTGFIVDTIQVQLAYKNHKIML